MLSHTLKNMGESPGSGHIFCNTQTQVYYLMCLKAMAKITEIGLVQKDRHIVRKNPAIQILRDASSQFYKFALQFGLMPVARRNSLFLDLGIPDNYKEKLNFLNENNG